MQSNLVQIFVFIVLSLLLAVATTVIVKRLPHEKADQKKEYFLAGATLKWYFIAGTITITNLSTDQLVGMNGNQMLLLAWWELAAVVGLLILTFVFLPVYYRHNCTTTTELLQKKYDDPHIRAVIAGLFLLGNLLMYQPIMLYTGALFLKSLLGLSLPILPIAIVLAVVGALYTVLGGLRAVAVSDTISGVGLLVISLLVVFLALNAIDFSFEKIPAERLTMIGDSASPIPWQTLLTGMVFIQMFYWSTNQTITQRAMAAPNLKEAQKGILAATAIRLLIVPPIVVIPGVVAYQLYGDIGDLAYGRIVADVLPSWLSGMFGAIMAAAVLAHFSSVLNASTTMYVCDLHMVYLNQKPDIARMNTWITWGFVLVALLLVPVYTGADSIINLVQKLNGLLSMPILSAFIVGLVFVNVSSRAVMIAVGFGTGFYALLTFGAKPVEKLLSTLTASEFVLPHYIHLMLLTLIMCILCALYCNRVIFGQRAKLAKTI